MLVRWALREVRRINHELEEARLATVRERTRDQQRMRTLRRDPVTGVYRPDLMDPGNRNRPRGGASQRDRRASRGGVTARL